MKTSTIVWIIVVIVIIIGGVWYYYDSNPMTPTPAATTTTTGTTSTPVVSIGTNATLGPVLVAANGMTLYSYNQDKVGVSNCTGQCLVVWPAYSPAAGASLTAGAGVTGALGTITRTDNGATQLTYNGMPLYFFAQDTTVGDAKGQNQNGFIVAQP
jgi:predicted lipoprotein with Yx(FWY)xxD motif